MKNNKTIILTTLIILLAIGLFFGITYAYFDLTINAEDSSTMVIGGAEVSASFVSTSTITVEDALPSDDPIGYKDFSITVKNTSNNSYKLYLKVIINSNTFTDTENDGVLYYDIYSGTNHDTVVQEKTMFPTITSGKALLKELTIPAKTNTTTQYRLNLYFPDSDKIQNKNGRLSLNASITIENSNTTSSEATLATYINNLYMNAASANGLEKDTTADANIRYTGANPNNYITFNDETWRIIGIFNVYNTETKINENLVKIIRDSSIDSELGYSWDTSESTINTGWGINEWSQADLMTELNTDYIDISKISGTTLWYNSNNNEKQATYDYSNNIKANYINKIANVRWNLGGFSSFDDSVLNIYNYERGTTHINNPEDGITRTNYWDGKIALMYPSDYGYASSDSSCQNNLQTSYTGEENSCTENNWLYVNLTEWLLSPSSDGEYYVAFIGADSTIDFSDTYGSCSVRPSLYLKSDVEFSSGTGTKSDPYKISIGED